MSDVDFYHPRLSSTKSLQLASQPHSEWAKAHAAFVSRFRDGSPYLTISDSRTSSLNFLALQHAIHTAMGQKCVRIEWVAEGGSNQVRLPRLHSEGLLLIPECSYT